MIRGFIKNSFVDYPGKIAATVFTGGCNFSCPFCHNGELVKSPRNLPPIPQKEIFDFLDKRKGLIEGLVITGGEPSLWPGLADFIIKVKEKGFLVKLDTNGYEPLVLKKLLEENLLDYIAMDIKNSPDKYAQTAGLKHLDISRIIQSINIIRNSGLDYEFRTTIMKEHHEEKDLIKIADWLQGSRKYVLQNYNPKEGQIEDKIFTPFSLQELEMFKEILQEKFDHFETRS